MELVKLSRTVVVACYYAKKNYVAHKLVIFDRHILEILIVHRHTLLTQNCWVSVKLHHCTMRSEVLTMTGVKVIYPKKSKVNSHISQKVEMTYGVPGFGI